MIGYHLAFNNKPQSPTNPPDFDLWSLNKLLVVALVVEEFTPSISPRDDVVVGT